MIVGLGNPGKEYEGTRHNTGRIVTDAFRRAHDMSMWEFDKYLQAFTSRGEVLEHAVTLVLPETYMNNSGKTVGALLKSIETPVEVVVIYDDLDLPLGTIKISYDRGSGGHHGLDSIIRELKTGAFTRIRIGITPLFEGEPRKPQGEDVVGNFLMKPFTPEERVVLEEVGAKVDGALALLMKEGIARAMNVFN